MTEEELETTNVGGEEVDLLSTFLDLVVRNLEDSEKEEENEQWNRIVMW